MGTWVTPFMKQCLVTAGVAINIGQIGSVMAFTAILLAQLKVKDSIIPIDDNSASWIAAGPACAVLLGNLTIPTIMAKCGRKLANIISVIVVIIGWFCVAAAKDITVLFIGRLFQGLNIGMTTSLGPILIGEYTSPKNRGPFLSSIGLAMSTMTLVAHTLGSYLYWKTTALVCASIPILNLFIVLYSPESPSWLADQGKYEQCEKTFIWLRGDTEEDELRKMIDASQIVRDAKIEANITDLSFVNKIKRNLIYFGVTIKKKEFYKPIFIVIHLYMMTHWGGINLLSAFTTDTFKYVVGDSSYDAIMIVTLDVQRLITNVIAIYVIRRIKRRTMLNFTIIINILVMIATGIYAYAKMYGLLPYDHVIFGALLLHIHTFSVVTGSLSLPMVISGEIFPMQYRSVAGGISALFNSINFIITVKTVLLMYSTFKCYGTFFIYAALLTYCYIVVWFTLPETKDKTLQTIEDEFKGKKVSPNDLKSAESLKSLNGV